MKTPAKDIRLAKFKPLINTQSMQEDISINQAVIERLWPIALLFLCIYVPVSFFILHDYLAGWVLSASLLAFVFIMLIYKKTKNVQIVGNMLAMLGVPVLLPWLISGGPAGAGLWWSIAYVVWAFFITTKRSAVLWLTVLLVSTLLIVVISQYGYLKIAYPVSELFNLLFAYLVTFVLVYLFDDVREYYLQLSNKRTDELAGLNRELISANNELEQFVYIASHDLQEPLRTISNFTGLLGKKYAGKTDEDLEKYLNFISAANSKLQDRIKNLLDYSRIGRVVSFADVDCNETLKEVILSLNDSIRACGAKITADQLPVIRANAHEIKQLFQHLISNAVKFRKKDINPEIRITVEETGDAYLFSISDNGIGIESRFIHKLFVVFQRLHTAAEYPGTGIGLAACKKIVAVHQGKIGVESNYGQGSRFYFSVSKLL